LPWLCQQRRAAAQRNPVPLPPTYGSAILPPGRRGQTVDTIAHQASDQGWSDGVVSRSEVVCPCGVGIPLGGTLPLCVRVTSAVEEMVDGVAEGAVRSKRGKRDFFINLTTVLPASGRAGLYAEAISGSLGLFFDPLARPRRSKWQHRRIIPPKWKDRSIIPGGVRFRKTVPEIYSGDHQQEGNGDMED
jgi:hypothetical protein